MDSRWAGLANSDGGLKRTYKNCIAAYNRWGGWKTNDYYPDRKAVYCHVYSNLAYHNGYYTGWSSGTPVSGFEIDNVPDDDDREGLRILMNNIAYDNEEADISALNGATYTHSQNSWDSPVDVSGEDFALLPETAEEGFAILSAPRGVDGSLPELGEYFHLAVDSDLLDAGIDVGLPYSGSAPDLGPFEVD